MNKSNLMKNLIFSLFFLLVVSILIMLLIFPQIKVYKKLLAQKQNQERINLEHTTQKEKLDATLNKFIEDNKKMIKAYKEHFDEKDFKALCLKYFNDAILNLQESKDDIKYQKYELKVSTNLDSPIFFYDFIKSLKDYKNIIKVEFPITLKAKGSEIEATFNIKVFNDF